VEKDKRILLSKHLLVWLVLFSLPYLMASGESFNIQRLLKHSTIPLLYYALIFYVNYLVLIDKFLFTPRKIPFYVVNILLISGMAVLSYEIKELYFPHNPARNTNPHPPLRFFFYIDVISMVIPLLFAIGLKTYERWIASEAARQQANNEKLISELQHLKYQLQPHFFFNSLNNIYALIDQYPDKAKETVHSLAKLMRYLLYDTGSETVSLAKEIDFMRKYIELMQLRTSEYTKVSVDFPTVDPQIQVAPLLFIAFVENAFKHGISATEVSNLDFKMTVDAHKITFTSKNLNLPKDNADRSGSGIGLENLKKRLTLLYPKAYEFRVVQEEPYYVADLTIEYTKIKSK
jgi:hypothetical protein